MPASCPLEAWNPYQLCQKLKHFILVAIDGCDKVSDQSSVHLTSSVRPWKVPSKQVSSTGSHRTIESGVFRRP